MAYRDDLSPDERRALASTGERDVLVALVRSSHTDPGLLAELARNPDAHVRAEVACEPGLAPHLYLALLGEDCDALVLEELLSHTHADEQVRAAALVAAARARPVAFLAQLATVTDVAWARELERAIDAHEPVARALLDGSADRQALVTGLAGLDHVEAATHRRLLGLVLELGPDGLGEVEEFLSLLRTLLSAPVAEYTSFALVADGLTTLGAEGGWSAPGTGTDVLLETLQRLLDGSIAISPYGREGLAARAASATADSLVDLVGELVNLAAAVRDAAVRALLSRDDLSAACASLMTPLSYDDGYHDALLERAAVGGGDPDTDAVLSTYGEDVTPYLEAGDRRLLEAVLALMLGDQAREHTPEVVEHLAQHGEFGLLPAELLRSFAYDHPETVGVMLHELTGEVTAAEWEIIESLGDTFTGTLDELLRVARELAVEGP